MSYRIVNPEALESPRGWNHGMLAEPGGRVLLVAGQAGTDDRGRVTSDDFVTQFGQALDRILTVVRGAGGGPEHLGRLTIFITDMEAYRNSLRPLGVAYRERMGRHFPAMALVEVRSLVDPRALVEIEATAILPPAASSQPPPAG